MSADVNTNAVATDSKRRPRRRALQSGFSLLARAEPQIWFTGGMLAVCLAMIASLIGLILASGLPTFWPQPIDMLVLRDGSLSIGELQTTALAPAAADNTANEGTDNATDKPAKPSELQKSHYYRTENFDLTNDHYRWFTSEELSASGIIRPEAATLVERFEWGHLYGLQLRIHEALPVDATAQKELDHFTENQKLFQYLQLLPTDAAATDAAPKLVELADAMGAARAKTNDTVLRNVLKDAAGKTTQCRVAGDTNWVLSSAVPADATIEAVRSVIVDSSQFKDKLNQVIPAVYSMRRRLENLKHHLSRLDVQVSRLRIAVRQSELDTKAVLPIALDGCHPLLEQLAELQRARKQLNEVIRSSSIDASAIEMLKEFESKRIPAEIARVEMELQSWRGPIADAPPAMQSAVAAYEAGYAAMIDSKRPIQSEIDLLQAELERGELMVAVPQGAKAIEGMSSDDAKQLADGKLTATLREQLKNLNLEVTASEGKVTFQHDRLVLIEIQDSAQSNHLLALATPGGRADGAEASAASLSLMAEHAVAFRELVRVLPVNQLSFGGRMSAYFSRWGEFLFEDPREANTLGGVFPAIWGTIVMTLIMTIAVVPFGVMAALYLREYTRGGPLVSLIRISINNLAGVPSIVYGVFGFSFFCMTIGSFIDGGPKGADIGVWPSGRWYMILFITVAVGTAAFLFSFFSSGPMHSQTTLKRWSARVAFGLWLVCIVATVMLIAKSPFFNGFYAAQLPNPTFGKGGLLWASLTLALLTLPVVIVATEEALAAVPNSLREGSLACGASKWQTIRRIILPHARPGILTGAILAMARGAGEVAPLMLVGALPNAPELPMDSEFPFFHGSRNFMHLGYQIYSLGFQSQNSEAAKPMVFTCTLLLILIVAALNIVAIYLRTRLRRRFLGNQF